MPGANSCFFQSEIIQSVRQAHPGGLKRRMEGDRGMRHQRKGSGAVQPAISKDQGSARNDKYGKAARQREEKRQGLALGEKRLRNSRTLRGDQIENSTCLF
ncbi:hypothetical protein TNCV_1362371 [Trichonephila clavipes]|nr:hypothetical protein TNCV_1362371 [Trichonephila clavipes]